MDNYIGISHWGLIGGAVAEPMQSHGEPVYGDVLWWGTDDKTSASSKFNNAINFNGHPIHYPGDPRGHSINYYDSKYLHG